MTSTEHIDHGRVHGMIFHADQPRGGIILLPTIFGIDRFSQGRAAILAEAGFTTLIWNPYPGQTAPTEHNEATARASKLSDEAVGDMSECVGYMLGSLRLPSVAVLGFCLGGRHALLLAARDHRLVCCVSYYPSIREPLKPNESMDAIALSAEIPCPVHVVWGTGDQVIVKPVFLKLREALERRKATTVAQVHPDAVHSFLRPDLQSVPANAAATRLSWPPALSFLETSLQRGG
jgi:carboxymethylenebutenolidase